MLPQGPFLVEPKIAQSSARTYRLHRKLAAAGVEQFLVPDSLGTTKLCSILPVDERLGLVLVLAMANGSGPPDGVPGPAADRPVPPPDETASRRDCSFA